MKDEAWFRILADSRFCALSSKTLPTNGLQNACKKQGASFHHLIGAPEENGVLNEIANYLQEEKLKPVIDKIFPFNEAVEAIAYQKAGRCAGKVVIQVL